MSVISSLTDAAIIGGIVISATHNDCQTHRFHDYWLQASATSKVHLHIVKYEELLTAPYVFFLFLCVVAVPIQVRVRGQYMVASVTLALTTWLLSVLFCGCTVVMLCNAWTSFWPVACQWTKPSETTSLLASSR